jgi:hypothetical protein
MSARGISLHLGLNSVDPQHYDGWAGALSACENDARDMAAIARSQGFDATVLLTRRARSDQVLRAIQDAARTLRAEDVFLITYAGHGARIADQNGDEPDRQDETWVLYDRMLIDDEIDSAFARFADGVRVVTVLDSCHSASATRRRQDAQSRLMPEAVLKQTLAQHKALYQGIQQSSRSTPAERRQDAVVLAACQDGELAADGPDNGLFTGVLKSVWNDGRFDGGYAAFWREIDRRMPDTQNPNLSVTGPDSAALRAQRPFSITSGRKPAVKGKPMTVTYDDTWTDVQQELGKRVPLQEITDSLVLAQGDRGRSMPERITAVAPASGETPDVAARGGGVVVRAFWWGFHVQVDHDALEEVLDSADTVNSLVEKIGGSIPSPAQPWIIVIAKFVAGAHALLRAIDQGGGIYISMSWAALGICVPTPVRVGRGAGSRGPATRGELIHTPVPFFVDESQSGELDTGLFIDTGQRLVINATGAIWAGVWLTGNNGPQGWLGWKAGKDSPLPGAPPFSLLARLDSRLMYIGGGQDFVYQGPGSKLYLSINDDKPGNGNGAFEVTVQVYSS